MFLSTGYGVITPTRTENVFFLILTNDFKNKLRFRENIFRQFLLEVYEYGFPFFFKNIIVSPFFAFIQLKRCTLYTTAFIL